MPSTSQLAAAFDALNPFDHAPSWSAPTVQSIGQINARLKISLPASFIAFALQSKSCGSWLASLGEDYDAPNHILTINSQARKIRRRKIGVNGQWEYVKPNNFVAFNIPFDSDYSCFDIADRNEILGEYAIHYWAPPRIFGFNGDRTFNDYLYSDIGNQLEQEKAPLKKHVLDLLA